MENLEFKVPYRFKVVFVWLSLVMVASLITYQANKRLSYWQRHVLNVMQPEEISIQLDTTLNLTSLFEEGPVDSIDGDEGPVLYHFWATWCVPCRAEIPTLDAFQKKFKSKLRVVAIAVDENKEDIVRFFGSTTPEFQVLWDKEQLVAERWGVQKYPETFLLIPGSKPVGFSGARDWNSSEAIDFVSRIVSQSS